jgi:biotin-(acetyl-CoA carboxylase) ligase
MKLNKQIRAFLRYFFHPSVFIFIFIGTAVTFLTFLTTNNALEIAISGIASVFIGIGVNNLSSIETHLRDEQKLKSKTQHSIRMLEIVKSQIVRIHNEIKTGNYQNIKAEFEELEQFMKLSIELIKKDESLD